MCLPLLLAPMPPPGMPAALESTRVLKYRSAGGSTRDSYHTAR